MLSNFFYKCFVEIANSENISLAAEKLNYSQGGLSHTINRAEEELGFKLFKRNKYGVSLTEEGVKLLPFAKQIVFNMQKMDETVASIHGLDYGHIKIATYASLSMHYLPELLVSFTRDYPGITIEIQEGLGDGILQQISDQSIDIAFTSFFTSSPNDRLPLFEDPMVAAFPREIVPELDENGCFPLEDLKKYKFILGMMEQRPDPDIEKALGASMPSLKTNVSSLDFISIMCMVRSGLGISVLPRMITLDYIGKLDFYPVSPDARRTLGMELKSLEDASAATQKFVEYVKRYTLEKFLPAHEQYGLIPRC